MDNRRVVIGIEEQSATTGSSKPVFCSRDNSAISPDKTEGFDRPIRIGGWLPF